MPGTVSSAIEAQTNSYAAALSDRLDVLHGDLMRHFMQVVQADHWQELAEKLEAENYNLRDQLCIVSERWELQDDKWKEEATTIVSLDDMPAYSCGLAIQEDSVILSLDGPEGSELKQAATSATVTSAAVTRLKVPGVTSAALTNATITDGTSSKTLKHSPHGSTITAEHIKASQDYIEAHTNYIQKTVQSLATKFEEELGHLVTRIGLSDMGLKPAKRSQHKSGVQSIQSTSSWRGSVGPPEPQPEKEAECKTESSSYETWPAWKSPALHRAQSNGSSVMGNNGGRLQRHFTHFEISEAGAKHDSDGPVTGLDNVDSRRRCSLTINPNSWWRMIWECLGITTLMFDLITIPLLVFDPPTNTFMEVMSWGTLIYWTLDILASLNVGYHEKHGVLIMNPRRIACHYFKTWFVFDILITGFDWASNVFSTRRFSIGRIIRIIRISRFLRLVRLMKLMRFFDEIRMRIDSEYVALLLELLQYMAFILAANHFIACAWYWIATMSAPEANWVDVHGFRGRDMLYLYTTSLHWSLTQFTPASMAVQPQNPKERTFAVVVLIFALIIFGSFVSSLTSAMTTLRQLDRKSSGQFWLLRKYLRQHMITRDLALRTIRYLTHSVSRQRKYIEESQVSILALLSEPLQHNLRRELYAPSITRHPFFEIYRRSSAAVFQHICGNCVHEEHLSRGDVLFHHSSPATHMFFLEAGSLIYFHMIALVPPCAVEVGQYFCEAVLWCPWMHRGEMCAKTECRMVALDSAKFRETVLRHVQDMELPMTYSAAFVEILSRLSREDEAEVTDLQQGIRPKMEIFESLVKEPSQVSLTSHSLRTLNTLMNGADHDQTYDSAYSRSLDSADYY